MLTSNTMWCLLPFCWLELKSGGRQIDPKMDRSKPTSALTLVQHWHGGTGTLVASVSLKSTHICANTTLLASCTYASLLALACSAVLCCHAVTWLGSAEQMRCREHGGRKKHGHPVEIFVNENTGNCCGCRKAICDCGTNTTNLYKCLKTPQIREGIPQTDPDLQRRDGGYWQSPVRDAKNIQVAHLVAKVMFPSWLILALQHWLMLLFKVELIITADWLSTDYIRILKQIRYASCLVNWWL